MTFSCPRCRNELDRVMTGSSDNDKWYCRQCGKFFNTKKLAKMIFAV